MKKGFKELVAGDIEVDKAYVIIFDIPGPVIKVRYSPVHSNPAVGSISQSCVKLLAMSLYTSLNVRKPPCSYYRYLHNLIAQGRT